MGITEKMWDAVTRVIRVDYKVERLAHSTKEQQAKIEQLTERVVRLETTLELMLRSRGRNTLGRQDSE